MVNIEAIEKTRNRLAPVVFHTPLAPSPHLSRLVGAEVFLKLENLQRTGSFKIRGAYSRLYSLAAQGHKAVVTASAGNHAQGVALAARLLNLKATIIMPENVSLSKREATAAYGTDVRLVGESVEDGFSAARSLEGGLTLVHPFDDEEVILGQGSLGLEILEDLPDLEAVVLPVGGGGLIAGVAAAIKAKRPQVMILGVEPSRAASAGEALKAGRPAEGQ